MADSDPRAPDPAPGKPDPAEDPRHALHRRAMRDFDEGWTADAKNREAMLDDLEFYAGEQWLESIRADRETEKRPIFTFNRLPQFVRQLTGDARQNTPAIKVMPTGDGATKDVAEILTGLIRNIEVCSDAKAAYTTAIEGAAQGGQGGWRVARVYSGEDGFEQDLRIQRIPDPLSILIDPFCREADKSDKRYAFVFQDISRTKYAELYPDSTINDFPNNDGSGVAGGVGWFTKDNVRLAEYWYQEDKPKLILRLSDGSVVDAAEVAEAGGLPPELQIVEQREITAKCAYSCICNGMEVLEGPFDWGDEYIPIAYVPGEEIVINGATVRRGMVRDAKDPQRAYNYTRTTAIEAIALQPKAPWTLTIKNLEGVKDMWDAAGRKNWPYLAFTPDPMNPNGPKRADPALAQQGLDSQAMLANDDLKGVTGIYDASLGNKSNETSGVAIRARQKEADTGTFLYLDNLARAIAFTGKVLIRQIPKVYNGRRIVRVLGEDGSADMAEINKPAWKQGAQTVLNDITTGEYDVVVSSGPSYATKRVEAAESLMQFMQAAPQAGQLIADLVAKNMDWPGADDIAKRLRTMLPPEIRAMEGEEMPEPKPDPEAAANALDKAAAADLKTQQAEKTRVETAALAMQLDVAINGMDQRIAMAIEQGMGAILMRMFSGQGGQPMGEQPPMMPQEEALPDEQGFASPEMMGDPTMGMTTDPLAQQPQGA
jgi:hypothetical protein